MYDALEIVVIMLLAFIIIMNVLRSWKNLKKEKEDAIQAEEIKDRLRNSPLSATTDQNLRFELNRISDNLYIQKFSNEEQSKFMQRMPSVFFERMPPSKQYPYFMSMTIEEETYYGDCFREVIDKTMMDTKLTKYTHNS